MRVLIDKLKYKLHQSELRYKASGSSPQFIPLQKEKGNNLLSESDQSLNKEGKAEREIIANNTMGTQAQGFEPLALRLLH